MDGDIHDLQQEEDKRREKVLSELELRIVRFGNDEVVRELSAAVGEDQGIDQEMKWFRLRSLLQQRSLSNHQRMAIGRN